MQILQKMKQFLLDERNVKIYFITVSFIFEIPFLMPYVVSIQKIGVLWAFIILLADCLSNRKFLKSKFSLLTTMFCISYFITIILNMSSDQFKANLIDWLFTCAIFFVLFGLNKDGNHMEDMKLINRLLLIMTTLSCLFGLLMLITNTNINFSYAGVTYQMGFYANRMVGVFRNAIYPTAVIGVFCAILDYYLTDNKKIYYKIFLFSSIFINYAFFILQNSKGLYIGFIFSLTFAILLIGMKKAYLKKMLINFFIVISLFFISIPATRTIFATANSIYQNINYISKNTDNSKSSAENKKVPTEKKSEENIQNESTQNKKAQQQNEIQFEREKPEYYDFMSGRTQIWETGINLFLKKPLMGYGPYTVISQISAYNEKGLSHFHNIIIESLVSVGLIGTVSLFALLLLIAYYYLKLYFSNFEEYSKNHIMLCIMCLLLFIFIINMSDTTILFQTKMSSYVFWIYLGFFITELKNCKNKFSIYIFLKRIKEFI